MNYIKQGETINVFLAEFTDDEWASISRHTEAVCTAQLERSKGEPVKKVFNAAVVDLVNRRIDFSVATDGWVVGRYIADIRFRIDGINYLFPPRKAFIKFEIVDAVSDYTGDAA